MKHKTVKKNEDVAAPDGFATLADTPGMGDVVMPTQTSRGSGDVFGSLMDFGSWRKRKKRKKRSRKF